MPKLENHFTEIMGRNFASVLEGQEAIAVAVSGGPDSLALMDLLYGWALDKGVNIHALTVDHGLRPEAKAEAENVANLCKSYSGIAHKTLEWHQKEEASSRMQERAREARYQLISDYMKSHSIKYLFLGHHMDDQAETFLFRLAKGSGLKGLSCMPEMREMDNGITLCRPLLDVLKQDLLQYCKEKKLDFVDDPSNNSEGFARVRLRKSMDILVGEGLSAKRLSKTALRLERAENALNEIAENIFNKSALDVKTNRIVLDLIMLENQPAEIGFRVILKAMERLGDQGKAYAPRMEKTETLFEDMMKPTGFRKRTLGGVIFEQNVKEGQKTIVLTCEQ